MEKNVHGQETESPRAGVIIDIDLLGKFVESKLSGFQKPFRIQQFKLGQSNPTFLLIDANERHIVVRKKPAGKLLSRTAHAIEREYQVLDALKSTPVPVPKVYFLCEDKSILGTPFYLMEFLHGRIFADNRLPTVCQRDRTSYYYSIVDILSNLHSVDISSVGLDSFGRKGGYYERQLATLSKVSQIQAKVTGDDGIPVGELYQFNEILHWLKNNIPVDEVTLIHGDYKTDNIVFHPQTNQVIGLLDWELSTIGHPLFDLANLLLPWYTPQSFPKVVGFLGAPRPLPVPEADELIQRYCKNTNRPYPIKNWYFCIAFAFFRVFSFDLARRDYTRNCCSNKERPGIFWVCKGNCVTLPALCENGLSNRTQEFKAMNTFIDIL